jgi:ElaB/YqjD/DUF883 family membrane-anchored ribosome-binding protein
MDSSIFPNNSSATPSGAASQLGGQLGSSAAHVYDATKDAGQQIGSVAKSEMAILRADLDSLVSRISSMTEHELAAAKEKLLAKVESTKIAARGVAADVSQQLHHGVDVTTDYVKERPLQSVAVAAGVGVLLGMLIARR